MRYGVTTRETVIRVREVEADSKSEAAAIVRRGVYDTPIIQDVKIERIAVIRTDGEDD